MRTRWLHCVVPVAVLAISPAHAAPVYYGYTSASSYAVNTPGITAFEEFNGAVPVNSISYSGANAAGIVEPYGAWSVDGQGTGSATVNAGGLHLAAYGSGNVINSIGFLGGNGFGYATGRFKDSFVVTVPNCGAAALCGNGVLGSMTVALNITGNLSANGSVFSANEDAGWNAYGNWAASLSVQASGAGLAAWSGGQKYEAWNGGDQLSWFNVAYPYAPFGSYTLTLPIRFGSTVSIDIFGVVGAFGVASSGSALTNAAGGGASNLGSTIGWGGIVQLLDGEGNPITDFAALSLDTGFDYQSAYAAVPLPAGIVLLFSGLSLLSVARRRREAGTVG